MGITLELEAVPTPSQLQLEENAIINSGWWNRSESVASRNICSWYGMSCNVAGSVTRINYPFYTPGIRLATLNLSAFKNLEWLEVSHCGLQGTIPSDIGNLPKLTHLENLITFMLPLKAVTIFIFASAYLVNLPPNSKNKAFTSGFTNSIK